VPANRQKSSRPLEFPRVAFCGVSINIAKKASRGFINPVVLAGLR
jgi:hypothetical protein